MAEVSEDQVVVVDVRIPFWSMVWLLVKVALAALPATMIVAAAAALVIAILE